MFYSCSAKETLITGWFVITAGRATLKSCLYWPPVVKLSPRCSDVELYRVRTQWLHCWVWLQVRFSRVKHCSLSPVLSFFQHYLLRHHFPGFHASPTHLSIVRFYTIINYIFTAYLQNLPEHILVSSTFS